MHDQAADFEGIRRFILRRLLQLAQFHLKQNGKLECGPLCSFDSYRFLSRTLSALCKSLFQNA